MAHQFSVFAQKAAQGQPVDDGVEKVVDMLILLKENKDNRFFRSMAYDDQFEERLVNDRTNPTCSDLRELVKTTSSLVQAYTIAADGSLNLTHLEEFGKLGCPISVVHKDAIGPLRIMVQIGVGMDSVLYAVFEIQRKKTHRHKRPSVH